ncbi:MAG: hydrogenase iron-sulfur subunit [Deltaproteobacteria bacterium]|nr:hydrogenase iron-sulfur subunit [Deltaproteobacteria bacterium]
MSFEPKILSFLCNWCAYAGADLAGISRFQYPPSTRVIRVMCSGRIDPAFIPRAFLAGFDGVMILGCHPGDCHYLSGNIQAERKITLLRKLLSDEGIGEERLMLDWVSAGEGQRFAHLVSSFAERIAARGPFPATPETQEKLRAIQTSLESEKIRWMAGKAPELLEKENVYGERTDPEMVRAVLESTVREELRKNRILIFLEAGPMTAEEISRKLKGSLKETLSNLVSLVGEGRVGFDPSEESHYPRYVRSG